MFSSYNLWISFFNLHSCLLPIETLFAESYLTTNLTDFARFFILPSVYVIIIHDGSCPTIHNDVKVFLFLLMPICHIILLH